MRWNKVYLENRGTPYSVSDSGDVRNDKFNRAVTQHTSINGYKYVTLSVYGSSYNRFVHVLVMEAFKPEGRTDERNQINHIDGNKNNNSITNLEWCSGSENIKHAFKTGLKHSKIGEESNFNKYPEEIIRDICQNLSMGLTISEVSKIFDIPYRTILAIRNGVIWKNVSSKFTFPIKNIRNSEDDIHKVCQLLEKGISKKEICDITGVGISVIKSIYNGNSWKRIRSKYNI